MASLSDVDPGAIVNLLTLHWKLMNVAVLIVIQHLHHEI